ncbi:DMT family transporter [Morganella morganii]|nr:DMT family transporter [Morganella morganii]
MPWIKSEQGELIILISAFFWATGTVLSEKIPVKSNLLLRVFYQNGISLLLIVLMMPFMSDDIQLPLSVISQPRVLLPVLYTGITGGVFVYILWFYMIEKGGAELTSCAILLSPVISVFISCFFLDESVTLSMLAGMLFIISGLFYCVPEGKVIRQVIKSLSRNRPHSGRTLIIKPLIYFYR